MVNPVIFDEKEHTYELDNVFYDSTTQILRKFGLYPEYEKYGNENSRDFGSKLHRLLELYDKNDLGDYDNAMDPWLNGYKRFLEAYQPRWELIEYPMVSKLWGFAGAPDRVGIVRSRNAVVDLKSGSEIPANELQTAAYQVLYEETFKGAKIKDRYTLIILPDDFRLIPHTHKADKITFLGLVNANSWARRKGVFQ
jgi:hypothetical protein